MINDKYKVADQRSGPFFQKKVWRACAPEMNIMKLLDIREGSNRVPIQLPRAHLISPDLRESRPAAPPRPAPWRPVHAHSRLGSTAQGSQRRRQVASRLTLGNGGSVGNIRTVKAHTWMAKGLAQCTHLTVSLVGPAPAAAGGTVKRQAPLQRGHDAWKSFGPAGGGTGPEG